MDMLISRTTKAGLVALLGLVLNASAQDFSRASYRLLEGSTLVDDCPVCARPTLIYPVRGSFELIRTGSNPLFTTYAVTNIQFTTSSQDKLTVTGDGQYTIGGEVAVQQRMTLNTLVGSKEVVFTNDTFTTDKPFPFISIELLQSKPTLLQVFSLKIVAAPIRDLWFSTASGFTPAAGGPRGTGGDMLSIDGHTVRSASNLVAAFGLPASAAPINVDAMDVQPGGEIWFSLDATQPTSKVGPIYQGDLLSDRGVIVHRNQELTAAFGIMPAVPDLGLDAVSVTASGEILFSITTNMFSERLGRVLRRGDLLSNRGVVVASNTELLSRFQPLSPGDVGLDAIYVWPSGEIWFSVEQGFQDKALGPIGNGDLLSNQGLIVYRNLELMSAFAPIEDLADFGLDALYVVSDLRAESSGPRITQVMHQNHTSHLEWRGSGRAFQVLRASRAGGNYQPVSPILPTSVFDDVTAEGKVGFYLLQQW